MAYLQTRLGRWFLEDLEKVGALVEGGTTIVLLHSLLCDGGMWRGQIAPLRELGRVVVFDGPGHGRSEVPPPFTLDDHASALLEAFADLRIERAIVVGLSWGGMLAMRLALLRPDLLRAMVLLDTSADGTRLRERLQYRAMCLVARNVGLPPALVRRKIVPLMFGPRTRAEAPELVSEFVRTLGGFAREGVARATAAVSIDRSSILDQLGRITAPTLVGYGADDTATPRAHSQRIAAGIPAAGLVPFSGAGHLSALESPSRVNAAIVPFVRRHVERHG